MYLADKDALTHTATDVKTQTNDILTLHGKCDNLSLLNKHDGKSK